jgi:glycosyltransferase involved in cell wall biosynthesis
MNSKGTLLYIGGFELPDKNAAAQRVISNAKAFRALGFTVVFLGVSHQKEVSEGILPSKKFNGFDYYEIAYPRSITEWISYSIGINFFKELFNKYQAMVKGVFLYNYPAIASIRIARIARENSIQIFADCTEWYSYRKSSLLGIIKTLDTELRMRFVNKRLDGVLAISKFLYTYYRKDVPSFNIPPLVDIKEIKWEPIQLPMNEHLKLVYAGSPGRKDRLDILVSAVNECNFQLDLRIIGITQTDFLNLYPELKEIKFKNISFLGRVSHQEALDEVKLASFTCFFRDINKVSMAGFPTKFVESVSAGTPVITNRTSDISDYCSKLNGCILIEDISVSSILGGLERAYSNKQRIQNPSIFDYRNYLSDFKKIAELFSR